SWGGNTRAYFEQLLANEGFLTFYVDNRAATAISKTLENEILLDGYGSVELNDLLDAVRWLKSQPYVDPDRVGIWGWSGGGSYTLLALTSSEEFRAGIAVAAVTDWHYYDSIWAEAFMKRPQDNPEGYEKTSHAERAKNLHGRLLLVHGTYDDNVHPQNAWRFIDELVDAGITFDLMIYPMRKHGITDDEAQKHLYKTMREFWLHNLKE
ncbi:MAG: prolyl oligopeptidase family serine peptidase, partial [Acidobacteriota bacterium]